MHLSRFILNLCNKSYRMNAYKLKYLINLHGNIARLTVFFGGGANKKRMDETLLVNKNRINLVYEAWYSVVHCLYVYISNKLHVLCSIKMNMEANDKSIQFSLCTVFRSRHPSSVSYHCIPTICKVTAISYCLIPRDPLNYVYTCIQSSVQRERRKRCATKPFLYVYSLVMMG